MIEIRAEISSHEVDSLEDFFCEDLSPWSIVHPRPEDAIILSGFFDDETQALEAWEKLRIPFPDLNHAPEIIEVADEDWMESYKFHLKPWSIGPLHWIPEWERSNHQKNEGDAVLFLDSGLAFGTGSHETTRLCARSLVDYREAFGSKASVIDAGCGSGILALSAALLGFSPVYAFDNDPEAIRVSKENAKSNNLGETVSLVEAGIEEGLANRTCDLLLANIQANVLSIYAQELIQAVNPSGRLALSGILSKEAQDVESKFAQTIREAQRSATSKVETDGEWSLIVFDF